MNVTDSLPLISFAKSATESDSSSKYNLDETEEFMTFKIYENVESRRASSFVVQFLILVSLIGIPWCFMETALGQYSGRGPTAIGDMVPVGKGVAVAMGYICLLNVICYSPIQSRSLLYMYWSITAETLPWEFCSILNHTDCIDRFTHLTNTKSKSVGIELRVPVEDFYINKIVQMDKSILYNGLGRFNQPLLMCLLISWAINYLLLLASNNFMKYVQIFGSIMPFIFLFVVLGITMTDDNAWGGFYALFNTSTVDFLDIQSWRRAAEQVLYSLDVGTGHLIIYGKNCNFRNNILESIRIVSILDILCAITSSMIVFGVANSIACKFHIMFQSVFISGPGMLFIVISWAMLKMPFPKFSSFLAFFILFVICILTQLSLLRPIIYLLNIFLRQCNLRAQNTTVGILCLTILGITMVTVTTGGEMFISLLEDIGTSMGILMITTFEAILIFGIYGINEFCADLAFMSDNPPSIILKILFIGAPVITTNIMFACTIYWSPPNFQNVTYPSKFITIVWLMAILTLLLMVVPALQTIVGFAMKNNIKGSFTPTRHWVPDMVHSLYNNELECMTTVREKIVHENKNRLIFGISKPRLFIKVDRATQTDEFFYAPLGDNAISNQRLQHFYLEMFNNTCKDFEFVRRHNENEIIVWDSAGYMEKLLDSGIVEKYAQTDHKTYITILWKTLFSKRIWVSIDETTDVERRFIANVIVGSLEVDHQVNSGKENWYYISHTCFIYKKNFSMKSISGKSASEVDSNTDICIAEGCGKSAVSHPEWDNEYCSIMCCYNHCKTTFKAWLLANRKQLTMKTNAQTDDSDNQASSIP